MLLSLSSILNMNQFVHLVYITVLIANNGVSSLGENENFTEFVNMVMKNINASKAYQIPKDNSKLLNVKSSCVKDFGAYDFIIIGSGAAGATIANRLSEISEWSILLLEAGGQDNDFTKILGLSPFTYSSDFSWGYNTTSQKYACKGLKDNKAFFPQGKVIGGGTTINAGQYIRGNPEDFDRWVDVYGNPGWSYADVLPYFKKSENAIFEPRDKDYHGVGGYVTIDQPPTNLGLEPIIDGFEELGFNLVDYNGRYQIGISKNQIALDGNERVSTARAFLENFKNRENLKVSLNSFVTKILISGKKEAKGVKFIKNGETFIAKARKEVIISAGGINSAQLLMLSGIGPGQHLKELGIPVKNDLPVGKNLQDHCIYLGFNFRTNRTFYSQNLTEQLKLYIEHKRPLISGFALEMIGFTNFGKNQNRPEIEMLFITPGVNGEQMQSFFGLNDQYAAALKTNVSTDIWTLLLLLHPKSRGTVTLKSKNPKDKPVINPNYLSEEEDVETLYKGIQSLTKLAKTKAFKKFAGEIVIFDYPNCEHFEKLSDNWWKCSIRYLTSAGYHPVSTNPMGPNPKFSVVNAQLKVHNTEKLRVADSSVIPEQTSGHIMTPTIMLGEKTADMIKEEYGKIYK